MHLLDAIADSFNPLLAILALAAPLIPPRRGLRVSVGYYLAAGAAIGVVYVVRSIDARHQIWSSIGLDYSTHSAFAASLAVSLSAFRRRWLIPVVLSLVAYFCLQLYMRYHSPLDIISSSVLAAAVAFALHSSRVAAGRP